MKAKAKRGRWETVIDNIARHPVQSHLGKKNEWFPRLKELNDFCGCVLPSAGRAEAFDTDKDNFICFHSNPKLNICERATVRLRKEYCLIRSVPGARF